MFLYNKILRRWVLIILLIASLVLQMALPFVFKEKLYIWWSVWKQITVARLGVILAVFAVTVGISYVLLMHTSWGTWSLWGLFGVNKPFNMLSVFLIDHGLSGLAADLLFVNFCALLILIIPYMAFVEEYLFRGGRIHLKERLFFSVLFGCVHVFFAGVSVGVVPGMAMFGFFLSVIYVREYLKSDSVKQSLLLCTAYHAWYNLTAFILFVIARVLRM